MCIADDSSTVKGVKADFIRISSKVTNKVAPGSTFDESERMIHS
jgi:hypothetical protein